MIDEKGLWFGREIIDDIIEESHRFNIKTVTFRGTLEEQLARLDDTGMIFFIAYKGQSIIDGVPLVDISVVSFEAKKIEGQWKFKRRY